MKFFIYLVFLYLLACYSKKDSFGPFDRLVVFGDPELWEQVEDAVRDSIGRPWELPRMEEKILIDYKNLDEFDIFNTQRNIMFLISFDKNNSLLQFAKRLLSERALNAVNEHSFNFFYQKDVYANNQSLIMFIVDKTDSAEAVFKRQVTKSDALNKFDEYLLERLRNEYFDTRSDQQVMDRMKQEAGFTFRMPPPFVLSDLQPKEKRNIVSIYSQREPLKWISVHTLDSLSKDQLTDRFVFNQRDSVMFYSFEKQTVVRDGSARKQMISLDGMEGYRYQGNYLYLQDGLLGGGPFILYALYDENEKRLYMIYGFLLKLKKRKAEALIYSEEMIKTFKREK